jgi:hypothetical protein
MKRPMLCVLAVALGVAANQGCTGRPRSEPWLRAHFSENREVFDRLVLMSNEDFEKTTVIRIAYDFTRLADDWGWPRPSSKWGITGQRWDEYRDIFRRLDLPAGLNRDGEGYSQILLMMYGEGMAGEGTEYGYLWSASPPQRIDDNAQFFEARPLEGMWYLYEWRVY